VTEEKNEEALLCSLCRYSRRPKYLRRCFSELFHKTPEYKEARPDIVKVCFVTSWALNLTK